MTLALLLGRPQVALVGDATAADLGIDGTGVVWTLRYVADTDTLDLSVDGVFLGLLSSGLRLSWSVWAELSPGVWTRLDVPGAHPAGNPITGMRLVDGQDPEDRKLSAGEGVISLRNANGWLDPSNPASPYFGRLLRGVAVQVRVAANPGGAVYNWWAGRVDRWPLTWEHGTAGSDLEVVDELGWLMQQPTPPTELARVIDALDPVAWWPLDGETGTAVEQVAGWEPVIAGAVASAEPFKGANAVAVLATTSFEYDIDPALGELYPRVVVAPFVLPPPPWTVALVMATDAGGHDWVRANGPTIGLQVGITTAGYIYATVRSAAGVTRTATHTALINRDIAYLVRVSYDLAGTLTLQVSNRAPVTTSGAYLIPAGASNEVAFGVVYVDVSVLKVATRMAHLAIWSRVLTAAELLVLTDAAAGVDDGLDLAQRVDYLLDLAGWTGGRDLEPLGAAILGHALLARRRLGEVLAEALAAEDGAMWVDGDGVAHARTRPFSPGPAIATLVERRADGTAVQDMSLLVGSESVSAARTAGAVVATYADSSRPPNELELSTGDMATVVDAWTRAEREVWRSGLVPVWVDQVTVQPVVAGMVVATAPVNSRLDVRRRPPWAAAPITERSVIVGRELVSGSEPDDETVTYRLRPALPSRLRMTGQGNAASSWSTPSATAIAIAADLVVEARVALSAWLTQVGRLDPIVQRWTSDAVLDWRLYQQASKQIGFSVATVGGGAAALVLAPPMGWADMRPRWIRATYLRTSATTAHLTLAWSWDRADWHTMAANDFAGANATIAATGSPLSVGGPATANVGVNGYVYAARLSRGSVLVAEYDPSRDGAAGAPSFASSTGETWSRAAVDALTPGAGRLDAWR